MHDVTFHIENQTPVTVPAGPQEQLLALAVKNKIPIDAPCGGSGTCGKCKIRIEKGETDAPRAAQITDEEYAAGWRLACQIKVTSDLTVFVPEKAASCESGVRLSSPASSGIRQEGDPCGLAVDIGTTTVAAVLADLKTGKPLKTAAAQNAQIRFGADVISRILEQGKEGGRERLQRAVVEETLNPMIRALCESVGISPAGIRRAAIAANTTMDYLLLGIPADPIRSEPYVPCTFEENHSCAKDTGLQISPDAETIFAPGVSGFVGGDITAGTYYSRIWQRRELSLLIDLGTNGELVLGNREFLICCACSAGPAFEGGDISCGMRASDGAIEACEIDPESMEPTLRIIGANAPKPAGVCGSGLIDVVSALFAGGIISPKGKFIREGPRIRHDAYDMGSYVLAFPKESKTGEEIAINEADIDNFIRAKAAIFSAVRTLLSSLDLDFSCLEDIVIAGGIGSGINIRNAVTIGMLPALPEERYRYIGNAALAGACEILFSEKAEEELRALASGMTYLDLSAQPGYMEEFVAACFLPHTDANLVLDFHRGGEL